VNPRAETCLMEAAILGNVAFLDLYYRSGGDINIKDPSDRTALHQASANGNNTFI